MQETSFRTVKGIWSLCLLVSGSSSERREGDTGMEERKKTDEKSFKDIKLRLR